MEQSESIIKLETNTRKDVDLSASFFYVHWACQQARTKACCRAIRHTRYCLLSLMRHHITPMILVMHHMLSHQKNSKDSKIYIKKQYNEYSTRWCHTKTYNESLHMSSLQISKHHLIIKIYESEGFKYL